MVFCKKCGTETTEEAEFCRKCGAPLTTSAKISTKAEAFGRKAEAWGRSVGEHWEEECFGLPGGGAICGAFFGVIVILFGLSIVFSWSFWIWIGPVVVIFFGSMIIVGALYGISRSRRRGLKAEA